MDDYALVGDDLLIRNNTTGFGKYIAFMDSIGLEVNKSKTIVSEDEDNQNIEFASNFVINSLQIIPVQYGNLFS